jgi:hypothetical protein
MGRDPKIPMRGRGRKSPGRTIYRDALARMRCRCNLRVFCSDRPTGPTWIGARRLTNRSPSGQTPEAPESRVMNGWEKPQPETRSSSWRCSRST